MSILPIVIAILIATLQCVICEVGNDDVSNYFSSYVPRDHRIPIIESAVDLENITNESKDAIAEGIKNEMLPQFPNLNLSTQLKNVLLKDYHLTKPYTRGDVSNLYNLDLLGSGLLDFNTMQKSDLWPSKPNYDWLKRNMSWPNLPHYQDPSSIPNWNSSSYNLCNNHMKHSNVKENSETLQPSINLHKTIGFDKGNIKKLASKEFENKIIRRNTENKLDIATLKMINNTALDDDTFNKLKNLTSNIVECLPSLSDIYVKKTENDLTKLFNSFNTSRLLNKYENI